MNLVSLTAWSPKQPEYSLIRSWRNHALARRFSFRKTPFKQEEFKSLFHKKYYSQPHLPPFWIVYENQKVGFISLKKWFKETAYELSLFLNPSFYGQGLAKDALALLAKELKKKGIEEVIALVLIENNRAKRVFEKAGFELQGTFLKETDQVYKFRRSLLPAPSFFVIAEAGSNFKGKNALEDLERAKKLIQVAYESGAQAVKFQLYNAKSVYAKGAGSPKYLNQDIHHVFDNHALNPKLIDTLSTYANYLGIEWMCSTFSESFFDLIDPFVKRHKIASYELRHLRLLERAAKSQKPLILSTGAATLRDIKWAIKVFQKAGGKELTLMHCNAQYPAEEKGLHLKCLLTLKETFKVDVGFSDHSLDPSLAPSLAYALGAKVIEKHFTLSKKDPGPDHFFALEPGELKLMIETLYRTQAMLGLAKKTIFPQEEELAKFARRGLHALRDIKKGEFFCEEDNVGILRPGNQNLGLHPRYLSHISDKRSTRAISMGEGLKREDIQWD